MLIGEITHSIDEKGRYIVPAKFREDLGERFIIAKGQDGCLYAYPLAAWEQTVESLKPQLRSDDPRARAFARNFFSRAVEAEVDKQFRVVLPQFLREYARLEKEIVSVGVSGRLEIWDKQTWLDFTAATQEEYEEDAARYLGAFI